MVKILLKHGADPNRKIKQDQSTPFSEAVASGKFDIINYFIDSLKVDIYQPMSIVIQQPSGKVVTLYIQDYLVNKYCLTKLKGDTLELERLRKSNKKIDEANEQLWDLIVRLKRNGVYF